MSEERSFPPDLDAWASLRRSMALYLASMSSFIRLSSGHSRHTTAMVASSMMLASERARFLSISLSHWFPPSRAKQEAVRQ